MSRPESHEQPDAELVRPYVSAPPHFPVGERREAVMDDAAALRPYLLTSGRARPIDDSLEIEAQVVATDLGRVAHDTLAYEHRDIVTLCGQPMSIAEIAAKLGLHIGVVRVLVGDVLALELLAVLRPDAGLARDVETIERVIRGLEAIS